MYEDSESSAKRQRVAETKAPAANTLRLTARNLPSSLEDHVLSFLDMDSVCDLRFLSKDMLQLVTAFVSATKRAVFSVLSFTSDAGPDQQPLLRSIKFLANHAQSLREFALVERPEGHLAWASQFDHLKQRLLPCLMLACRRTLERVVTHTGCSDEMLLAATECPSLRVLDRGFDLRVGSNARHLLLQKVVESCPALEELSLFGCSAPDMLAAIRCGRPLKRFTLMGSGSVDPAAWMPHVRWPLLQHLRLGLGLTAFSLASLSLLCTSLNAARGLQFLDMALGDVAASADELAEAKLPCVHLPSLVSLAVRVNRSARRLLVFDAPLVTRHEGSLPSSLRRMRKMPRLTKLAFALGNPVSIRHMDVILKLHRRTLREFESTVRTDPDALLVLANECLQVISVRCKLGSHCDILPRRLRSLPELIDLRLWCLKPRPAQTAPVFDEHAKAVVRLQRLELRHVGTGRQLAGFAFLALLTATFSGPLVDDVDPRAMPSLQQLSLRGRFVTEQVLGRILGGCKTSLTRLELGFCRPLWTLSPLYTIKMPRLQQLDVSGALGIRVLPDAAGFPGVHVWRVSAEPLIAIAATQPALWELRLAPGNLANATALAKLKDWLRETGRRLHLGL